MAVLGLQGVRGGVGTTTITAALAWSLQMLGENVLVVDACPDNLLRLSFNVDFTLTDANGNINDDATKAFRQLFTSYYDVEPINIPPKTVLKYKLVNGFYNENDGLDLDAIGGRGRR